MPAYMNATNSGNNEANGMTLNPSQYAGDPSARQNTTVHSNVHSNYSPNRGVFSNGSNNSPNTNSFSGHPGKLKAAALLASSKPPG